MRFFIFSAAIFLLFPPAAHALGTSNSQPDKTLFSIKNYPKEWGGRILEFDTQNEGKVGSSVLTTPFGKTSFNIFRKNNKTLSYHANLFSGSNFIDGLINVNSNPSIMEFKNSNEDIISVVWATSSENSPEITIHACVMQKPIATCSLIPLKMSTATTAKMYDNQGNNIAQIVIDSVH